MPIICPPWFPHRPAPLAWTVSGDRSPELPPRTYAATGA